MSLFSLIFLAILATAFLGFSFQKRSWGLAIFCALLPAYLIRYRMGLPGIVSAPTTFLETLFLILFLPWLIERGFKKEAWAGLGRWAMPTVLFLVAGFVSVGHSADLPGALGLYRAYFLEPVLFFVMFTDTIKTAKDRRYVLIALGTTMTVVGLHAIYQKLTGDGIPNPVWRDASTRRVTAFYGFPNAIGLFAAPVTVMMFAWTASLFGRGWKPRLWSLATLGVALLGVLASYFAVSKGALLGILAGVVIYGLTVRKLRPYALGLIIAASLAVLAYQPLNQKAVDIWGLRDSSSSVRIVIWEDTLKMMADRPVFGAGLSGYRQAIAPYHTADHIEIFMYPHNIFLNFWSEIGIIGLAAFIWLLILLFVRAGRLHAAGLSWLPLAILSAMAAIVIHGLVDVPYFKNDLAFLFWILLGLTESLLLRADHPGFWEAAKKKLRLDEGKVGHTLHLDGHDQA